MTEQKKIKWKKETDKVNTADKFILFSTIKSSFELVINYPKIALLFLYLILLIFPFGYDFISGNVLLKGEESYYHLSQAQTFEIYNWQYAHLFFAQKYLPLGALSFIPLILGFITIYCLYYTIKKVQINTSYNLIFLSLLMISPLFLYAFRTLSSIGLFIFLISIGLYLFFSDNFSVKNYDSNRSWFKIKISDLSIIPFILASSIDGWSTFFLLFVLFIIYLLYRKENSFHPISFWITIIGLFISFTIHQYLLPQPLFIGPFIESNIWNDLITDFGGFQGMSIFMCMLGIIGFILLRKRLILFYSSLFFLIITFILYIYNTAVFFSIGLWFVFLSSVALSYLIERTWTLHKLKHFTILVIILGLLFTTMTYSLRLSSRPPTPADAEVLDWVKENIPANQIIFTSPAIGNYVSYYSHHPVVSTLQNSAEIKGNFTQKVYSTAYITELFPLLEGYDVSLLYITPEMRQTLPSDQNLLFLLKNERFKLVYSTQDTEMWLFTNRTSVKE